MILFGISLQCLNIAKEELHEMLSSCLAEELSVSQLAELTVLIDLVYIQDSYIDEGFIYLFLSPK